MLAVVAVTSAVVASTSAGAGARPAKEGANLQKVTLRLGWVPKEEYAFLYAGRDLGFFRQQGIALKIETGLGSFLAMQVVGQGDAQFGYTGGPSFFVAKSQGIPLKMVATFLQENPIVMLSWPNAPVRKVKDIEGKSIILTPGDGFTALWPTVAERAGVDRSKVNELAIGVSARAQAFVAHQADVIPWFVTTSILALQKSANVQFVRLYADDIDGAQILSNGLFSTSSFIQKNPDLVRRMTAATVKSWNWTQTHSKAAAKIMTTYLPGYDVGQVIATVRDTMRLAHTKATKGKPTGWMARSDWVRSVQLMKESGQLKTNLNVNDLYTNRFIPGAKKAKKSK